MGGLGGLGGRRRRGESGFRGGANPEVVLLLPLLAVLQHDALRHRVEHRSLWDLGGVVQFSPSDAFKLLDTITAFTGSVTTTS